MKIVNLNILLGLVKLFVLQIGISLFLSPMNCVATFTEYDHEFNQGIYNSTAPTVKMLKEINNYLPSSIVNCVVNRYYFYSVI